MKCKCEACEAILDIKNEDLKKLPKPIVQCPSCTNVIKILPREANCGKCGAGFSFYSFHFSAENKFVKCPQCSVINSLNI